MEKRERITVVTVITKYVSMQVGNSKWSLVLKKLGLNLDITVFWYTKFITVIAYRLIFIPEPF